MEKIKSIQLRERFNTYYEENFKPSLVEIAKSVGIDYSHLINWRNGKRELGYRKIKAIEEFLDNHTK